MNGFLSAGIFFIGLIASSSSFAMANFSNPSPSLKELMNMHHIEGAGSGPIDQDGNRDSARINSMIESATVLGIHSGYNYEIGRLHKTLTTIQSELDDVFDFGVLMRSTNTGRFEAFLLPGVVDEQRERTAISQDGKSLTFIEYSFEILEEEKFVTEQPNWRHYLLLNPFKKYQSPYNSLLPKTELEGKLWREAVRKGWSIGINQANEEIIANGKNLRRDFIGMVKYLRLILEDKIDSPALAFNRKLVESDGLTMNINRSDYQISTAARFNPKSGEWEVIPLSTRGSLRKDEEKK